MNPKNKYVKIPLINVVIFSVLLIVNFFFSFSVWLKTRSVASAGSSDAKNTFSATKSDKPKFQFFVMSFCPYGNQIEDVLRPVFDLLGSKADIEPHYIFDKIDGSLSDYCKTRAGDVAQCSLYVQNGYFKDNAECKKIISQNREKCLDEKQYLKIGNNFYTSLHGRIEANQDVREICAWNQVSDKKQWWEFVKNVNQACTSENADTCWEEQAKKANLDTAKINECFNKEAASLIDKEIALTKQYNVSGSPTLIVNGVNFPPESAYTQDGKGDLLIGKKAYSQAKFRTPDAVKAAICASFNKAPKECNSTLAELSETASASGGCN